MTREIEFRLLDHDSADGELLAHDAVAIISAFRDLTYRVTRAVADRPGLGRTAATIERLATVRVALRDGSTRVVFVVGDETALIDPLAKPVDDVFWSIVEGIDTNTRPGGISDSVAESVDHLVIALAKAAPRTEIIAPGHQPRLIETAAVSRSPWQRTDATSHETVVHGTLEMVDLRSARFRLRDAAGNAIDLHDVGNAAHAAHLVGSSVMASGMLSVAHGTHHHRMDGATITDGPSVADRLGLESPEPLDQLIERSRAVEPSPPMNLPDEEWEAFLAEIHG